MDTRDAIAIDAADVPPTPLLSGRSKWTLGSLSLGAAALALFALLQVIARVSDSIPLGASIAVLSFVCACAGIGVAVAALIKREGWAALAALLVSALAALAISPVIFILLLLTSVID